MSVVDDAKRKVDAAIAVANIGGLSGEIDLEAQALEDNIALGERALQTDFYMDIEGMEDLRPLVRTTQMPDESRGEPMEDFGPHNQGFYQYANKKNHGQITVSIVELATGAVRERLRYIIQRKIYVNIRIRHHAEGAELKSGYLLKNCVISADVTYFDTSAASTAVNIPLTISYSGKENLV